MPGTAPPGTTPPRTTKPGDAPVDPERHPTRNDDGQPAGAGDGVLDPGAGAGALGVDSGAPLGAGALLDAGAPLLGAGAPLLGGADSGAAPPAVPRNGASTFEASQ